jgi:hypothetical protein
MMMSDSDDNNDVSYSTSSSLLPEEVWENIALNFLSIKDILSLLCVNRRLYKKLNHSVTFWNELSLRDGISCYENENEKTFTVTEVVVVESAENNNNNNNESDNNNENENDWRKAKKSYLFRCYKNDPSEIGGGVKWYPIRPYGRNTNIDDREGHISCVLKRNASNRTTQKEGQQQEGQQLTETAQQERTVIITGGFSNDDSVCK